MEKNALDMTMDTVKRRYSCCSGRFSALYTYLSTSCAIAVTIRLTLHPPHQLSEVVTCWARL